MNAHKQGSAADANVTRKDVRYSSRLLKLLITPENFRTADGSEGSNDAVFADNILAVARLWHLVRQSRTEHFSPAMFGEPAWDILLALYLNESSGPPATISNVARTAGIPVTTAFRWLDYLDEKRLVERHPSTDDGRAVTVTLSDNGRGRLERYFADVLATIAAMRVGISAAAD